jgi:hypothetical protein
MNRMKKLIPLLLGAAILLPGCGTTLTNGSHVGIVTAVEKSGVIWKTWDVYVKTDATSSQEDTYCVEDDDVISTIRAANLTRKKVELIYHDEFFIAPWRCGSSPIIDSIKAVE